tara:strand:+ start:57 stop:389 length:333 start_codon:yes stop_codon:yes gene_type:complete
MANHPEPKMNALAHFYHLTSRKGAPAVLLCGLAFFCFVVFVYDGFYHKHEKVEIANVFGFYAYYGFVCFTLIIFAALALRKIIKRREDYYGDQDINAEETPEHIVERKDL